MGIIGKKKTLNILEDGMLVPFEFLCSLNTLEKYEEVFMKKWNTHKVNGLFETTISYKLINQI